MFCNCLLCVLCIYCFFPLFYCPVVSTTAAGALVIDYVVDDRTPLLSSFQARRAIPLSHISPTYLYLSVALGICCFYVNRIQLHSFSLSPLDFLYAIPMQPDINKYYTTVNPAPC